MRPLLNQLLFFPERRLYDAPHDPYEELTLETEDGERLHAWWIPASEQPSAGAILFCHGNGGNIGDRTLHAALLHRAGFDVLLFDYRGYGRSTGRASEEGTYRDARAAREAIRSEPVFYLGESLGGAVAIELALHDPPSGLILTSTFTSVRNMARKHYPFLPAALVPDAYPSIDRIANLRAPLLVLHGDRDDLVPLLEGEELYENAPAPKRIEILEGAGHNDLITVAGPEWAATIREWAANVHERPL